MVGNNLNFKICLVKLAAFDIPVFLWIIICFLYISFHLHWIKCIKHFSWYPLRSKF